MRPQVLLLACLLIPALLLAEDRTLRLPVGDPARRDRQAPVVLDAVTDTRTGALLTPGELAGRLKDVKLLLVGEGHTDIDSHRVQLRVIEELMRSGRRVILGLEMYPYTEQKALDQWADGLLTEEGFLRLSRWYENWGYHWNYYRDIFLYARDQKIRLFAINAPRDVISKVRQKGFSGLTPEEAAHIPKDVDTTSADHRTLFKAYFSDGDAVHSGMTEEQWDSMIAAQATWDATMAHNAVKALRGHPDAIMVVLVGSGHVVYGLGIERQAARHFEGMIASVVPVNVKESDGTAVPSVQASYADFVWGLPPAADPLFPTLGLSTGSSGDSARKVIFLSDDTPAGKAGFKVGDVLLTLDGTPVTDKETLNRLVAGKRWGDEALFTVQRGEQKIDLTVVFRR